MVPVPSSSRTPPLPSAATPGTGTLRSPRAMLGSEGPAQRPESTLSAGGGDRKERGEHRMGRHGEGEHRKWGQYNGGQSLTVVL